MKRFFIYIVLAGILTHCGSPKKQKLKRIDPISVKNLKNDLNLNTYLLTCTESHLIAVDHRTAKISVFDYDILTVSRVIGRRGKGPGEFISPVYAAASDSNVYISDGGNLRITVFNSNDWTLDTTFTHLSPSGRFVFLDGFLYLPPATLQSSAPFIKMNVSDGSLTYFGKWANPNKPRLGHDSYSLVLYHHTIIAVAHTKPIIKFFNEKGKLLAVNNLSNEPNIAETLAYAKQIEQPANINRYVILFQDAAIYKNYLILNLYKHPNGRFKSNNYLVYKIDNNNLKKAGAFRTNIHGGYTFSFCVHNNKLYSNGGLGGINLFVFDLSFLDGK